MSGSRCLRKALAAAGLAACVAGCYTVNLSETTHPEKKFKLCGGPGARQGELVRVVRQELTYYSGERVSFGIMPGMPCMANDFGGGGGYVPAGALCLFVGPFVNAFTLAIPTLCTLAVEPFTMTSDKRGLAWDAVAMGFVGAYRWRVPAHDEVKSECAEDVLIDGGYRPDTAKIKVSKSADGTKLWHEYPGFAALMGDVKANGKVDVLFSDGDEIRRFSKSKQNKGCLSFADRRVGK